MRGSIGIACVVFGAGWWSGGGEGGDQQRRGIPFEREAGCVVEQRRDKNGLGVA